MRNRYNAYGQFLKNRFGCRVYKVSVDAGFSCPNRDGTVSTGGCTYCNNDSFSPRTANRFKSVSEQVREGIAYYRSRAKADRFIVYFQPFSNTHAPLDQLRPLYEEALNSPDVVGISVGTRPDCIDEEKIEWFESAAARHFITLEYGLQSVNDATLARINRGHDFRCWADAMRRTRGRGIWLGAHLILGFPWESREDILRAADILSESGLHFLKLHHLHVVRNTVMGEEYEARPFPLPALDEYSDLVIDFLERLSPHIIIERLFGTAPRDQLIAPIWGKSKAEIQRYIEQRLVQRKAFQGSKLPAGK